LCPLVKLLRSSSLDFALVSYPLSDAFRARFERTTGSTPTYLGLAELRRKSLASLIQSLAGLKACRLFIPIENERESALLPVFFCFAALTAARTIILVKPDTQCQRISRIRALAALGSVLGASVYGRASIRRCRLELASLVKQDRIAVHRSATHRVLYLKTNLWMGVKAGGSIGHVAGVVNGLCDRGYAVDVAAIEPPPMANPDVRFYEMKPPHAYGVPYELNLYRFQEMFVRQARQVLKGPYGFIYQRMSVSNYAGVILSRQMHVPLVMEYNGSEVWASTNWGVSPRYYDLALQVEEMCLKHAHLVVTVSQALHDELLQRGVPPQRIALYPNCINPKVFDPGRFSPEAIARLRQSHGIPSDALVAAFVGTFGPWHGVEKLAEAIRSLSLADAPWLIKHKLHFLIVGDGLRMRAVQETLADVRCRPFYTLTGLVSQAEAPIYMAAADILVSPHVANPDGTKFFGSPTKLFEYMAMGRAILASNLGQIGEVLERSLQVDDLPRCGPPAGHDALAVLCPPGEPDSLICGIRFLAEHADWRALLGDHARKEALSRYTWDRHVNVILQQLAAANPDGGPGSV
jgi:glycosyltransferase involved in cell wall biosynthesis